VSFCLYLFSWFLSVGLYVFIMLFIYLCRYFFRSLFLYLCMCVLSLFLSFAMLGMYGVFSYLSRSISLFLSFFMSFIII